MKKHLYLMIGVPGSGKSTYAKNILKYGDIYISRDEIRYSLLTEEDDYFAKENEVIKTFIDNIDKSLVNGLSLYSIILHFVPNKSIKFPILFFLYCT